MYINVKPGLINPPPPPAIGQQGQQGPVRESENPTPQNNMSFTHP